MTTPEPEPDPLLAVPDGTTVWDSVPEVVLASAAEAADIPATPRSPA